MSQTRFNANNKSQRTSTAIRNMNIDAVIKELYDFKIVELDLIVDTFTQATRSCFDIKSADVLCRSSRDIWLRFHYEACGNSPIVGKYRRRILSAFNDAVQAIASLMSQNLSEPDRTAAKHYYDSICGRRLLFYQLYDRGIRDVNAKLKSQLLRNKMKQNRRYCPITKAYYASRLVR